MKNIVMQPQIRSVRVRYALVAALSLTLILVMTRPLLAHDTTYVVQKGETLSEIAQRFGTATETLIQLNSLEDADLIYSGLSLLVPDDGVEQATGGQAREAPAGAESYLVRQGENLSGIARARDSSVAQLVALNQIDPDETLMAGQSILVPVGPDSQATSSVTSSATSSVAGPGEQIVHTVQPGEYLGILADRYGTSVLAIARANDLGNAEVIVPGQQLTIPVDDVGGANAEAAAVAQSPAAAVTASRDETSPVRTGKWIDVDLSEQTVVAYEDMTPVRTFIVSTGLPDTPTVQGEFRIWTKTSIQDMYGGSRAAGDYYYLEDVKWVQYFFEDYAFHGTYWHNNFGQPMSRGCVNMTNEDAKWLFEWASPAPAETDGAWKFSSAEDPGTLVIVHE